MENTVIKIKDEEEILNENNKLNHKMNKKEGKKLPFLVKLKTEEATPQKERVPLISA